MARLRNRMPPQTEREREKESETESETPLLLHPLLDVVGDTVKTIRLNQNMLIKYPFVQLFFSRPF